MEEDGMFSHHFPYQLAVMGILSQLWLLLNTNLFNKSVNSV